MYAFQNFFRYIFSKKILRQKILIFLRIFLLKKILTPKNTNFFTYLFFYVRYIFFPKKIFRPKFFGLRRKKIQAKLIFMPLNKSTLYIQFSKTFPKNEVFCQKLIHLIFMVPDRNQGRILQNQKIYSIIIMFAVKIFQTNSACTKPYSISPLPTQFHPLDV